MISVVKAEADVLISSNMAIAHLCLWKVAFPQLLMTSIDARDLHDDLHARATHVFTTVLFVQEVVKGRPKGETTIDEVKIMIKTSDPQELLPDILIYKNKNK